MQQNPNLVMMYRDMDQAVARQQAIHAHRLPAPRSWSIARAMVGSALIALGTRISPMPRPTLPVTTVRPVVAPGQ
jgi:hypothetical protein